MKLFILLILLISAPAPTQENIEFPKDFITYMNQKESLEEYIARKQKEIESEIAEQKVVTEAPIDTEDPEKEVKHVTQEEPEHTYEAPKVEQTKHEKAWAIVNSMPAELKSGFTDFRFGEDPIAKAFVNTAEPTIIYYTHEDNLTEYIVYHEMAHIMDLRLGLSKTETWKQIHANEWANKDVYGSFSEMESFAESVSAYFLNLNGSYYGVNLNDKPLSRDFISQSFEVAYNEEISIRKQRPYSEYVYNTEARVLQITKNTKLYDDLDGEVVHTLEAGSSVVQYSQTHKLQISKSWRINYWGQVYFEGQFYWIELIES